MTPCTRAVSTLPVGTVRALETITTDRGLFAVLAVDHRDSLRAVIDPSDPGSVPAAALTALKLDLIEAVGRLASGVMLEPEYSIPHAVHTGALPGSVGFLAALEQQGYLGQPDARETNLLPGWNVEKVKRCGASAAKLLVLYRPESGRAAERQESLVAELVEQCRRHELPLLVEPLGYDVEPAEHRRVVVESARRLSRLGPTILKLPFPAKGHDRAEWLDACAEVDAASTVPWALLSAGASFEVFSDQLELACQAGASGFMAGRAIWNEAATAPDAEMRRRAIQAVVLPRFGKLVAIAAAYGRSWRARWAVPEPTPHWYVDY